MQLAKMLLVLALAAACTVTNGAEKPNIVVILADDLGYADLGCQGCQDIPTPHIDLIAQAGVRFTDGYATHPVCSPSRAGLMSGRYQHRFGFEYNRLSEDLLSVFSEFLARPQVSRGTGWRGRGGA